MNINTFLINAAHVKTAAEFKMAIVVAHMEENVIMMTRSSSELIYT